MKPLKFRVFLKSLLFSFGAHLALALLFLALFWPRTQSKNSAQEFFPVNGTSAKAAIKTEVAQKEPEKPLKLDQRSNEGASSAGVETEATYLEKLRQQIKSHQIYPILAIKRRLQGVVKVRLVLDAQGNVISSKPLSEPNSAEISPILIKAAEDSVRSASPFLAPPAGISRIFDIPILFRLEE